MSTTPPNLAAPAPPAKLVSTLVGDPDMAELIQMFVDEIPERSRLVQEFWDSRNFDELRRLAHQLKGACGGYGFPSVGHAAGRLEEDLMGAADSAHQADLAKIARHVNELIDLCRRVHAT